jgi:hypothetical protein
MGYDEVRVEQRAIAVEAMIPQRFQEPLEMTKKPPPNDAVLGTRNRLR